MGDLIVYGYHGTGREAADLILGQEKGVRTRFLSSSKKTDWLGDGVYFFQDAPHQAKTWPQLRFPLHSRTDHPVVLCAKIQLTWCLDLLDIEAGNKIAEWYPDMKQRYRMMKSRLPRNHGGRRFFDRTLINFAVEQMESTGRLVASVRAAFQEGKAIVPGSKLYSHSHVQIVVRPAHTEIIKDVWEHDFNKGEPNGYSRT